MKITIFWMAGLLAWQWRGATAGGPGGNTTQMPVTATTGTAASPLTRRRSGTAANLRAIQRRPYPALSRRERADGQDLRAYTISTGSGTLTSCRTGFASTSGRRPPGPLGASSRMPIRPSSSNSPIIIAPHLETLAITYGHDLRGDGCWRRAARILWQTGGSGPLEGAALGNLRGRRLGERLWHLG